jgi:hypothetical protein
VLVTSFIFGSTVIIEQNVEAQKMTNASNLTGIENSSSASVTARLDVPAPEPEPGDYPTHLRLMNDLWKSERVIILMFNSKIPFHPVYM